ncbi:MAG: pyridoxal-phosphate dependent enzyme [Chloroflexi bacterium]|nr:pyridoxal-phosphate dependent enzyme [Chloroflexota bacterium]MBP8058774.1 pyridoxal-phosphate dependent enzyme [Chloroflexota bacterium]
MNSHSFSIRCRACQHQTPYTQPYTTCPNCGQSWLDAVYDLETVRQQWPASLAQYGASLWRYRDLLPVRNPRNIVSLGEGWTPLIQAHNLGLLLGHDHLFIKDERQGPTASFKDRQATVAISVMKEAGVKECVVASTGNVAIAYSAFCARAGIKLWTFVTSSVPAEKMREVALYGSEVIKVAGTYDQCKQVAMEFAHSKGIYLDKGIRAISSKEAMKTLAFEVAEQLGAIRGGSDYTVPNPGNFPWQAPDWYLQSVSGGLGPVGVMKGFRELKAMGLIDKIPKLALFQVAGCAPMVNAFQKGSPVPLDVDNPLTDITTLATGRPGEAYQVLRELIREHGGTMEIVTDAEAFRALHVLAKMDGLSVEPATAVTFAGLFNLIHQGIIGKDETVVVNCSGHTFPVEKHIVGEHHTRDMVLDVEDAAAATGREEGLVTALEELDPRVQRIAIIEDNPDATRLIRRILQAQGEFLIEEATNGLDGLNLIRRTRPNLVILDLMMPGLDGFGVVEAMKKDSTLQEIPIIVITAKTLTPGEKRWLDSQVDGLWEKGSFMDVDLLSHIRKKLP